MPTGAENQAVNKADDLMAKAIKKVFEERILSQLEPEEPELPKSAANDKEYGEQKAG